MSQYLTVTLAAGILSEQIGKMIPPTVLSDLLYKRVLDVRRCPLIGDRRMIPADYLPKIIEVLQRRGVVSSSIKELRFDRPVNGGGDIPPGGDSLLPS